MVIKWFPAAVAAVFLGPALAAAQAPGTPTVEYPAVPSAPNAQTTTLQTTQTSNPELNSGASTTLNEQATAAQTDQADPLAEPPAAQPPIDQPAPAATLMGMAIVPDRSDRPVIQGVEPGSPAARAGLREDDLIEGLGRQATPTMHELLNSAIPLIRNLDPGTKLTWHVNRDGRDVAVSIPRPTDRELGPLSDVEQRILDRQAGTLGYYSSSSEVPVTPPRRHRERPHVGHDQYADMQYNWWYEGDDMPSFVSQWVNQTLRGRAGENQDYQYYWWYNGDEEIPQVLTQWIQQAGQKQAGRLNPDLQYYWWNNTDEYSN